MDTNCTIYRTADFIGKKWTLLILLELYKGRNEWKRFNEIKRNVPGITSKVLSLRLKELESESLIKAKKSEESSEYSLTKPGVEFIGIIKDMKKWALKNKFENKMCNATTCRHCEF